jgi:uncharacterized protein (DUF952 family)
VSALFHITSAEEAGDAVRAGVYAPGAFEAEGFIHCSYSRQICDVANRLFSGRSDLVLLEIDRTQVTCRVVDENLEGGAQLFPHIYGRLQVGAVVKIHRFPCGDDGRFELPETVTKTSTGGAAPVHAPGDD